MATINVQGRIDMKSLATVARAYIERGSTFISRSDLMWKIVEDAAIAAERLGVERPETEEAALEYLESVGINLAVSDRGRRQVRAALIQDTGVHDYFGEDLFAGRVTRGKQRKGGDSLDSVASKYQLALDAGYKGTYREFVDGLQQLAERPVVVDESSYQEKEAKRLAAEKAAYSPEALRAAMKGGGEGVCTENNG